MIFNKLFGNKEISNQREKEKIFKSLEEDIPVYIQRQCQISNITREYYLKRWATLDIIANVLDAHIQLGSVKHVQMFNRVLVYYYGYKLGDKYTLLPALEKLSNEYEKYTKALNK